MHLSYLKHALSTDGVDEHSELVMSPLTRFFSLLGDVRFYVQEALQERRISLCLTFTSC
jgi:hypothetical protein